MAHWVIPTKIFAYLSAGKPVLMAMEGAAADLVRDSRAGIIIRPGDAVALSQGIRALRDLPSEDRAAMGLRGREYLLTNFSKRAVLAQYEQKLRMVARRTNGPRDVVKR
jgi:glycosyltransferase involved in cell wall biosynthesis